MKFKVGQRVIYIGAHLNMLNKKGTILRLDSGGGSQWNSYIVDFDNYPSYKEDYAPLEHNLRLLNKTPISKYYKNLTNKVS